MTNSYPLETLRKAAATNRLQIATLIGDLAQSVDLLTAYIEHEEEKRGVRDLADPTYPLLARTLRGRRDNIEVTIASLEATIHGTGKAA